MGSWRSGAGRGGEIDLNAACTHRNWRTAASSARGRLGRTGSGTGGMVRVDAAVRAFRVAYHTRAQSHVPVMYVQRRFAQPGSSRRQTIGHRSGRSGARPCISCLDLPRPCASPLSLSSVITQPNAPAHPEPGPHLPNLLVVVYAWSTAHSAGPLPCRCRCHPPGNPQRCSERVATTLPFGNTRRGSSGPRTCPCHPRRRSHHRFGRVDLSLVLLSIDHDFFLCCC